MSRGVTGFVLTALLIAANLAYAQQNLVGIYVGEFLEPQVHTGPQLQVATLDITKVADGKVSGKFNLRKFDCRGDYPVEGDLKDDKLDMRTGEGSLRGCGQQPFSLKVRGNKLVGTYGGYEMEFSKK